MITTPDTILGTFDGWWCTECESLCHLYEQGLVCACRDPWEDEQIYESDYPEKWIKCEVEVRKAE